MLFCMCVSDYRISIFIIYILCMYALHPSYEGYIAYTLWDAVSYTHVVVFKYEMMGSAIWVLPSHGRWITHKGGVAPWPYKSFYHEQQP